MDRVSVIFPPQISTSFVARLANVLEVDRTRLIDMGKEDGDVFTSSLPAAFERAYEQGLVKAGEIGLIITVGSGIQVGCALYYFS
jgi:3-oxoacyl-[acyl-carrier-protein] synthase III